MYPQSDSQCILIFKRFVCWSSSGNRFHLLLEGGGVPTHKVFYINIYTQCTNKTYYKYQGVPPYLIDNCTHVISIVSSKQATSRPRGYYDPAECVAQCSVLQWLFLPPTLGVTLEVPDWLTSAHVATVLHCNILYCNVLHSSLLHSTALHCT